MGISQTSLTDFFLPLQVKMEDRDYSDTQSPTDQSQLHDDTSSTQENTVDSTVNTEQQGEEGKMYIWRISLIIFQNIPYNIL